jgi:hypothetical protein
MPAGLLQDEAEIEQRGRVIRTEGERALERGDRIRVAAFLGVQEADDAPGARMVGLLTQERLERLQRPGMLLEEDAGLREREQQTRCHSGTMTRHW